MSRCVQTLDWYCMYIYFGLGVGRQSGSQLSVELEYLASGPKKALTGCVWMSVHRPASHCGPS